MNACVRVCACGRVCVCAWMFADEGNVCVLSKRQNLGILSPDPGQGARDHFSITTWSTGFQNSKHTLGVHLHNNQLRGESHQRIGVLLHLSKMNNGWKDGSNCRQNAACETIKQIQELKSPSTDKDGERTQSDSMLHITCICYELQISLQLVGLTSMYE